MKENSVRIIVNPEKDRLTGIVDISHGFYRSDWQAIPKHSHTDVIEFCLCTRGALVYECNDTPYTILPDNVFAVSQGQPHHITTSYKGMRLYWLAVDLSKHCEPLLGLPSDESNALRKRLRRIATGVFSVGPECRNLFQMFFTTYAHEPKGAYRSLLLRNLLIDILVTLIRCSINVPSTQSESKITRIANEIERNPTRRYTISELAAEAGLSESRFTAMFRQVIGLPPYSFLTSCRLEAARKRLLTTDEPIADIARKLGFSSPQHFACQFRKTYGLTASDLRNG